MKELIHFLFSTVLGYAVVVGAVILKVPQILKIVRGGNANGVSLTGNLLETAGYTISASWGIARQLQFKDYGENIFVLVQLVVLCLLIARHQRRVGSTVGTLTALALSLYALSQNLISPTIHEALLTVQIGLGIASRLPQIYLNYRQRATGQLSFITFFLAFGGGGARLITTALNVPWEKGKAMILLQYAFTVTLNGIILGQILLYKNSSSGTKSASGEETKQKKAETKKTK